MIPAHDRNPCKPSIFHASYEPEGEANGVLWLHLLRSLANVEPARWDQMSPEGRRYLCQHHGGSVDRVADLLRANGISVVGDGSPYRA